MFRRRPFLMLATMAILWAFLLGVGSAPNPVHAISLGGTIGDLVKIFGIAWVVDRFSGDINDFINSALSQRDAAIQGHTKVVPILRVGGGGGGTAVGAAQVMGPRVQVDKVQAVAEVELNIANTVRARGLIPISTRNTSTVRGVGGVGVSANVKFPL